MRICILYFSSKHNKYSCLFLDEKDITCLMIASQLNGENVRAGMNAGQWVLLDMELEC